MTDGAIEAALERTSEEQIRLVRFLYADHGGIIRGKAAGTSRLRERMASGIGHTVAMMAMSMLDQLQPVAGMGPVGVGRAQVARCLPWAHALKYICVCCLPPGRL